MNKTIESIDNGNMGGVTIGGIVKTGLTTKENIYVFDINEESLARVWESHDVNTATDNAQLAKVCDIIVLSVKPFLCSVVTNQIKAVVKENVIIVVITTGQSSEAVAQLFGRKIKVVETMPNTPALVDEGIATIAPAKDVTKEEIAEITAIFDSFGKSEVVSEHLMDAVTTVSESSLAYAYMVIGAMADAIVVESMPRPQAHKPAAWAVLRGVQIVLETGKHPGELKDMVCSPGGTTIVAAAELEGTGFRSNITQNMKVCVGKSREMLKQNGGI